MIDDKTELISPNTLSPSAHVLPGPPPPKNMSAELSAQIATWQEHCRFITALINSCPALDDLATMKEWADSMHEWLTYVGHQTPIAEAEFARACLVQMADIPPDVYKLIKNHSGQIDRYMQAKNPELFTIWQQLKNLGATMNTILYDVRTQMVSQREIDQRGAFQRTSQTEQPQRNSRQSNAVEVEYVWPNEEKP